MSGVRHYEPRKAALGLSRNDPRVKLKRGQTVRYKHGDLECDFTITSVRTLKSGRVRVRLREASAP